MGRLLDDSELPLFDLIAMEQAELMGDDVNYYAIDRKLSKIDPLYGEYAARNVNGPFLLPGIVKWPKIAPSFQAEGLLLEFDGMIWIARGHLDLYSAPYPTEGDIFEMWRTPFHDARSKGTGMFFDVIKSEDGGHLNDTASFVTFQLTVKRRTDFAPERKISPP